MCIPLSQIKPQILELSIRRGPSISLSIVFIFFFPRRKRLLACRFGRTYSSVLTTTSTAGAATVYEDRLDTQLFNESKFPPISELSVNFADLSYQFKACIFFIFQLTDNGS